MPYNENTNWDNEEKYLNNLVSQGGGNATWAQNQLKELNNARAQYGGQSGGAAQNDPYSGPNAKPIAPSLDVSNVKSTQYHQGDTNDYWRNDQTDYSAKMMNAQNSAEFAAWAKDREHKAAAQGIDISGQNGAAKSNAQLYEEWLRNNYNASQRHGYIGTDGKSYQGYYGMDSEGHWGYYDDSALTRKSANGTWDRYASSDGGYVRVDSRGVPDLTIRDMSRAGQTVYIRTPQGQYRVTYNENGYPTQAVKDGLGYHQLYNGPMYTAKTDSDQGVTSREMLYDQYGVPYIGQGGLSWDQVDADENERRMHVTGYQKGTRDLYERLLAERGNRPGIGPMEGMEQQIGNPGGYAPNPGRGVTSPQGGIDFDNEERYLNGLIAQGGGNAEWAKKQLADLNEARKVMQERTNPGGTANPTDVGNNSYLQMIDGTKYLYANDPNSIGAGNVYQGGLGSGGTGREVMQARTPDGQIINVEYINGVRQTDIPDGTIVHTAGGDFVYHAQSGNSSASASASAGSGGGGYGGGSGPANDYVGPLTNRAPDLQPTLDSWLAAARAEAELKADYAVSRGVNELTRAEQDAQQQFQTQRNQVDAAAARATDNQALYNERRGDRGGIGAAQYDAIANTAAQNQLTINQAQTKLSTDTARQIADLRAQGEFQKADSLLQLSQTYLSQLIDIQQWAAQFNLSVDEFNKEIEKWNLNYEMDIAQLLGNYRGQRTLAGQSLDLQAQAQAFDQSYREASLTGYYNGSPTMAMQAQLAEAGIALAQMGIMPSQSQMAAMQSLFGYDQSAVQGLVQTALLAQQAKLSSGSKSPGGSGGKSSGGGSKSSGGADNFEALYLAAYAQGNNAKAYISNHYKEFGFSSSTGLWDGYQAWADEYDPGAEGAGTIDSASQLGAKAKSLYNSISGIRNAQHLQTFGARVQAALTAGEITDAEADFLLRSVNY